MTVAANDRGLTLGDGLFETVLADAGRLVDWPEHLERLERGCGVLGLFTPDPGRVRAEALAALEEAGLSRSRAAIRLTWTAGAGGRGLDRPADPSPVLVVTAAAAPAPEGPASLVTSAVRRNDASPASRLKTLSYIDQVLARREAALMGADEALMLNTGGELACAAAANLFWIEGGALHTPALACGVLDGTVRARVIAASPLPVFERRATLDALLTAEAVFLTSSLIGVRRVCRLDGRELGGEPLVQTIAAALD
jgi:branched-chain amino acid aminotransferase/4-amino-4-deoxychorismate lyase